MMWKKGWIKHCFWVLKGLADAVEPVVAALLLPRTKTTVVIDLPSIFPW